LSSASQALKVIYAPHKVFKEIVQNPKFSVPILIAILSVLVGVGSQYAAYSKINLQESLPSLSDQTSPSPWTFNTTLWTSNSNISESTSGSILASLQFNITNGTQITAQLDHIGPVDCSDNGPYKNLTIALQWIHPAGRPPQNATLFLNSSNSDYFYYDLTAFMVQTRNGTWGNLTLPLGPSSQQWVNSSSLANWSNITSLKLDFEWGESDRADISLFVDALFFVSKNFQWLGSVAASSLSVIAFNEALNYIFYWILFTFVAYLVAKAFQVQAGMKTFLVLIGYALVGWLIIKALFIVIYVVFPPIYELFAPFGLAVSSGNSLLFLEFYVYNSLFLPIWPMIIMFFAARNGFDLPSTKSAAIAIIGFIPFYVFFALSALGII
jgi:hypothetical protein